jgi:basic amino acid/polyamine antiporter, APA family
MHQLQRRLKLFDATTIVVGSMIGSGIFFVPSLMAGWVQTPGILIGLWLFGGVFTILGAICYAELAGMAPHAGGQYVFLREAYSDFWAFLYGWTNFLVIQTGCNAAVAIAFAKYLGVLLPALGENHILAVIPLGDLLPTAVACYLPEFLRHVALNSAQLVACGVIAVLTAVNIQGVHRGALVQNLFTVLKVAALAALIVAGLSKAVGNTSHFLPLLVPIPGPEAIKTGFLAGLAVALSKALFAYDTWNSATFVAEEVHQPQRTVPRAMLLGTVLVTAIYVLANLAYLAVLPAAEMARIPENRVAQVVASMLFGDVGLYFIIVAILISTFGCVNGMILSGARVYYAMARERLFFRGCARLHPTTKTPAVALLYEGAWSMVLVLTGSYSELLTYVTFASVFFGGMTVAGVYRLRWRQPNRPRPCRCWGYPLTPALYLAICLPFLLYVIQGAPTATLIGVALVLTGIPFYFGWRRRAAR